LFNVLTNFICRYPQYQFLYWLRSVFIPSKDFDYQYVGINGLTRTQITIGGWKAIRRTITTMVVVSMLGGIAWGYRETSLITEGRRLLSELPQRAMSEVKHLLRR
jgi:hypothetical protein